MAAKKPVLKPAPPKPVDELVESIAFKANPGLTKKLADCTVSGLCACGAPVALGQNYVCTNHQRSN